MLLTPHMWEQRHVRSVTPLSITSGRNPGTAKWFSRPLVPAWWATSRAARFSCAAITTRSANGWGFTTSPNPISRGKPQEHRVDYTLGSRRMQHYLTTLPDGKIVVLPPTWDVQRKQWFHNLDIADPD